MNRTDVEQTGLNANELRDRVLALTRSDEVRAIVSLMAERLSEHEGPVLPHPRTMTDEEIRHALSRSNGERYKALLAEHERRVRDGGA